MSKIETSKLRTWITIDKSAIKNNYQVFRKLIGPKVKLMSVVKSNAYGHGLVNFAKEVASLGADYVAVDSIVEAERLRKEGITTPIFVLGYTRPINYPRAVELNIELAISSLDSIKQLIPGLKIHLKVDTGMHRQGFLLSEFSDALGELKKFESDVQVVGVFSHFASASDVEFKEDSQKQIVEYKNFLKILEEKSFDTKKIIKHMSASGATFNYPEAHFDMVRVGLSMYGLWPSRELEERFAGEHPLKRVMTWQTIIGEVKILTEDGHIGYDFTEEVKKGMRIAVCPIGYWHGYPRHLSSIGHVLVRGERAKILGRVSMDMIAIDVSNIPEVKAEDVVTVLGEGMTARHFADQIGTSQYEFITTVNPLIKKFYI